MNVDVECLRKEILLSQPAPPPQCDSSLPRLPAVGTRLNEPGATYAESQSIKSEESFPLQVSLDVCTSLEHGTTILLQADVGVDDDETTTAQAAAHEEFARPPKNLQQQRVGS